MAKKDVRTVWSSEYGDLRKEEAVARKVTSLPPNQQVVYLHRDSKGRGGKSVTLVKGLMLSESDMKELGKKLKQLCGSGGAVKEDIIEIQGEHRAMIAEALKKLGYRVKIAGG